MANSPTDVAGELTLRYLSPQEFSRLSGLSLATVHRYLKKGRLPYRQPGGPRSRILIPAVALEAAATVAEITPAALVKAAPAVPSPRLPGPRPRWAHPAGKSRAKEQ